MFVHIRANQMLLSRVSFEFTLYLNYAKNAIYKIRILFFIEEGLWFLSKISKNYPFVSPFGIFLQLFLERPDIHRELLLYVKCKLEIVSNTSNQLSDFQKFFIICRKELEEKLNTVRKKKEFTKFYWKINIIIHVYIDIF